MTPPLKWIPGASPQHCVWTSVERLPFAEPVTIDDLALQNMLVVDEYPAWCVDDYYAPALYDGTEGQSPL